MSRMSRIRTLAVTLLASALAVAPLAAQSTASASLAVTAKVINPLSLSVTAPLDFGSVFAGTPKTITPDASNGGRFTISGEAGAAVSVTLQMPTVVTATGGATIPLSSWTYAYASSPAMVGATPDNWEWIRRKRNVVLRYHRSSYAIGLKHERAQTTLQSTVGLDLKDYSTHGGSFPINLEGTGCVGAITVSGLPQREDHELVVSVLQNYLQLRGEDLALEIHRS